jgi:hypothetical protein
VGGAVFGVWRGRVHGAASPGSSSSPSIFCVQNRRSSSRILRCGGSPIFVDIFSADFKNPRTPSTDRVPSHSRKAPNVYLISTTRSTVGAPGPRALGDPVGRARPAPLSACPRASTGLWLAVCTSLPLYLDAGLLLGPSVATAARGRADGG